MSNDEKIWLSQYGGVIGFDLKELNAYIDDFNKYRLYRFVDFWNWLSCESGQEVHGFSYLWNQKNKAFSKLHKIKGL